MRRPHSFLVLLLAAVALTPTATALGATSVWDPVRYPNHHLGDPKTVHGGLARTVDGGDTILHAIATSGGQEDNGGVIFARSTDDGASWAKRQRLNSTSQRGRDGVVVGVGSSVYVAWARYAYTNDHSMIYVRRNTNHGFLSTWSDRIRLTSDTGRVDAPSIAAIGSNVFIAYTDAATGQIWLHVSRDSGRTWARKSVGSTTRTIDGDRIGLPQVTASGETVAVFWMSNDGLTVRGRISTRDGYDFGATTTVGTGVLRAATSLGSRVAVSLEGETTASIRIWRSGTWGAPFGVPTAEPLPQGWPVVALRGSNEVGVAWTTAYPIPDGFDADTRLIWRQSPDGGLSWDDEITVSESTAEAARRPTVVWRTSGTLYVLWDVTFEDGGSVRLRARL